MDFGKTAWFLYLVLYFREFAVICDAKRCDKKRMYRPVNRELQPLFEYGCEFFEHAGTAYNINGRNLIALQIS